MQRATCSTEDGDDIQQRKAAMHHHCKKFKSRNTGYLMEVIQIQTGKNCLIFKILQFLKKSRFIVSNRVLQTHMTVGSTGFVVEGYAFKILHKLFEINLDTRG